jgi:hypothetical protein
MMAAEQPRKSVIVRKSAEGGIEIANLENDKEVSVQQLGSISEEDVDKIIRALGEVMAEVNSEV